MSIRTAVVLAAGEGTRLRPLTRNRPKPMLPAANRPILEHVLDALVDAGIQRLVLVVGYRRERVQDHFGPDYRGVPIEYVVQEKQLGSGHALQQAESAVAGPMLVVNGDRVIESASVERVIEAFDESGGPAAMAVRKQPGASRYGVVTLAGREIEEIVEKPESGEYNLINAGIYAFAESVFETIEETPRESGELALPDTLTKLLEESRVRAVEIDGLWVDATYPWDLLAVATEVLQRGLPDGAESADGVWIDDSARVHENATLRPPVVIGPDCEIGPGTVLGPDVAVGDNATVGANATVERSVLDTDSRVDHGVTLIDAVLGQGVDLGAGTTVAGGPGDVRVDRTIYEDQPLGAVLADRVEAGGDVSFAPGTLVGAEVTIEGSCHVRGNVESGAEVTR
jgi:UDP-N-acetylglucosamine diphosphorylase/glucosamine-1-phosphate N-acetyltransferase